MGYEEKFPDWKQKIIEASNNTTTASAAAAYLSIKFDTYKKYAIKYGVYKTNQSGKGTTRKTSKVIHSTEDILNGKVPQFQSNKLRLRLLKEKVFIHKCNKCNNTQWLGLPIPLELEHKDGNSSNHKLENLELLCPNCHAFTSTYRGKNTIKCRDLTANTLKGEEKVQTTQ